MNHMRRKIGIKDKNGNEICESDSLTLDLTTIDLEPESNWLKLLIEAKNNGVNKIYLKFESLFPLLRLKYTLFADSLIPLKDYPNGFKSTLNDVFFLYYILPMFVVDVVDDNMSNFSFDKENPFDIKDLSGDYIKEGEEYLTTYPQELSNIPEIVKFFKFSISHEDFQIKLKINVLDSDKKILLNKSRKFDDEINENDPWFHEEWKILCPPFGDEPYLLLKKFEKAGISRT